MVPSLGIDRHRDQARDDRQRGDEDLREGPDQRRALGGRQVLGRQRALHLGEVRRPVAERQDEAEPHDDADPVAEGVAPVARRRAGPGVEELRLVDLVLQAAPPADVLQPDDHQRHQAGDDHEELQHLVVDRAGQPAEGDVGQDEGGGQDHGQPDRPADQRLDHQRQRVEVDAGRQHGRRRKAERVEEVRGLVEPAAQELRHAADLGAVVERHHHQAEEDHGRDGADPVEVHRRDAVLRAVGGHAEDLDRPEVGRDEGQPGDPGR